MSEKKIVIIVGPNGAGKTTFAQEFPPNKAVRFTVPGAAEFLGALQQCRRRTAAYRLE